MVADAGYDCGEFHAWVEEQGATPLTNYTDRAQKPAGYQKADFSYDVTADCYQCPAGRLLRYQETDASGRRRYRSRMSDCKGCPQQGPCLGNGNRRSIFRLAGEESRARNIARCQTEAGQAALRRRKSIVEPPFGHLKTYGGLRLINCRGQAKARVKVIMAAVAWDLIKLVGALGRTEVAVAASRRLGEGCITRCERSLLRWLGGIDKLAVWVVAGHVNPQKVFLR